jgi:polyisoprenyl-teichoic acid--peptidoglycan teichoic acid transferase
VSTRSERRHNKHKPRKRRRLARVVSIIALVLVLGIGGYLAYAYSAVKSTADKMHINLKSTHGQTIPSMKNSINILLLGVDERPNDPGRSDTIIVATLNPKTKSMLLTSIPRDTRTLIVGTGQYNKINSAYPIGGVDMAVNTVENFAHIKIDYVGKINMKGLSTLVDAVGGITVDNPIDWYDEGYYKKGYHYKKGVIFLHGGEALGYVRMRHLDPLGDFGRNLRQRLVIQAIMKKAAGPSLLTNLNGLLNAVGDNVKTDATFGEMKAIAANYRQCRDHVYTHEAYGVPQQINGIDYVVVDDQERIKIQQMIQDEKNGTLDMSKYASKSSSSSSSQNQ